MTDFSGRCSAWALNDPNDNAVIVYGYLAIKVLYLPWPVADQALNYYYWFINVAMRKQTSAVTNIMVIERAQRGSLAYSYSVYSAATLCYDYACNQVRIAYAFEYNAEVNVKIFCTSPPLRELTIYNINLTDPSGLYQRSVAFTRRAPPVPSSYDIASFIAPKDYLLRRVLVSATVGVPVSASRGPHTQSYEPRTITIEMQLPQQQRDNDKKAFLPKDNPPPSDGPYLNYVDVFFVPEGMLSNRSSSSSTGSRGGAVGGAAPSAVVAAGLLAVVASFYQFFH